MVQRLTRPLKPLCHESFGKLCLYLSAGSLLLLKNFFGFSMDLRTILGLFRSKNRINFTPMKETFFIFFHIEHFFQLSKNSTLERKTEQVEIEDYFEFTEEHLEWNAHLGTRIISQIEVLKNFLLLKTFKTWSSCSWVIYSTSTSAYSGCLSILQLSSKWIYFQEN